MALDDIFDRGQGSFRIIWKPDISDSQTSVNLRLFAIDTISMELIWSNANSDWRFQDGAGNNIEGAATSFTAQTAIIFHCVYEQGRLELYIDGSSYASGSNYDPQSGGNWVYLGSDGTPDRHANGIFMGFNVFDRALTDAEVLADYNDKAQLVAQDQRVDAIPWEWTLDGDSQVDNCYDSTREMHAVFGGIPGSIPALTRYLATMPGTATMPSFHSLIPVDEFVHPNGTLFNDQQGQPTGASDCGGEVDRSNVDIAVGVLCTHDLSPGGAVNWRIPQLLSSKDFFMVLRHDWSRADNLLLNQRFNWSANALDGEVTAFANDGLVMLKALPFFRNRDMYYETDFFDNGFTSTNIELRGLWDGGSGTSVVDVDYTVLMPMPFLRINAASLGFNSVIIDGTNVKHSAVDNSWTNTIADADTFGKALDLVPGKYNILLTVSSPTITHTWTWNRTYITPRFAIL